MEARLLEKRIPTHHPRGRLELDHAGRRKIRAVGEQPMPLNETYPLAVTFIIGERASAGGVLVRTPIGTGFVLRFPSPHVESLGHEYIVTAAHIVESGEATWVRFRKQTGGVHDLPVERWSLHPTEDVALTPLRGHGQFGLHLRHIPGDVLIGNVADWAPALGDRVYFLGLLSQHEEMGERNIPMVRSGTIGALYERVPIKRPDETIAHIEAHLIDCRSYAGFSGSPCFVQRDEWHVVRTKDHPAGIPFKPLTFLLGLVSGHFDDWHETRLKGDLGMEPGSIESLINTGVGVVTPSERILETFRLDENLADRERVEREYLSSRHPGATLDVQAEEE